MFSKRLVYRAIVFTLPLVAIIVFLIMKMRSCNLYAYMVSEDSFFEYVQALSYLSAGIIFLVPALKGFRSGHIIQGITLCITGSILIFIALEEVSWGQRIFGIKTPEWFRYNNIQNEISIHNLEPVQKTIHLLYAMTGAFFVFGWIPRRVGFLTRHFSPGMLSLFTLLKPRLYLMTYFLPLFLFYSYLIIKGSPGPFFTFNDQEIPELLLSVGILLYSTDLFSSLKRSAIGSEKNNPGNYPMGSIN